MFALRQFQKYFLDKNFNLFYFLTLNFLFFSFSLCAEQTSLFLGPRVSKNTIWVGNQVVLPDQKILVMAGHADSQNIQGEGTSGEAVDLLGSLPMDANMSDELFWNLKVKDSVVKLGKRKGLIIDSYDPGKRTILNENDSETNWSVGSDYAAQGVYVLEIHFDSYGKNGSGSGLIPPLSSKLNNIDESLAQTFGRYPLFFRGGLGAARRQIRILEIGKLEGDLEKNLRDLTSRQETIDNIATKIVDSLVVGITKKNSFNPQLQKDDIFLLNFHP